MQLKHLKFGMPFDIVISKWILIMAQLVVRNIEDDLKERLRRRARLHGRSMEEEVREILRKAVKTDTLRTEGLGTRLARRFAGIGLTEDIPEWRGEEARPAKFRK